MKTGNVSYHQWSELPVHLGEYKFIKQILKYVTFITVTCIVDIFDICCFCNDIARISLIKMKSYNIYFPENNHN